MPQSVDNLGFETDGLNLFAYKHNRPLNVNEIKTATTSSTYNYTNSTDFDISQALLIGAGAIGNVIDIADNSLAFVSILKKIDFGKYAKILGGIGLGISFASYWNENKDIGIALIYTSSDALATLLGSSIGTALGGIIGGLAGAIFGTLVSILLTEFIDYILDWLISELLF